MRRLCILLALALTAAAPTPGFHYFTALDHRQIAYTVQGEGPPMVVIPGGPGLDGAYMRVAVQGLRARSYVMDPRGTGRSHVPERLGDISLRALVSDIEELRKSLHVNRWIVMGHSFGGFIAQAYAANYPEHIQALILVSSTAPDLSVETQVQEQMSARLSPADRAAMARARELNKTNPDAAQRLQMQTLLPKFFADRKNFKKLQPYLAPEHNSTAMARVMFEDLQQNQYAGSLQNLHAPVLVVYGQKDAGVDTFVHAILKATSARVAIVKNAGHFIWLEQPGVFDSTVNTFINNL